MDKPKKKYSIHESQGEGYKIIIREPFPAINTTNSFECDKRTAHIIHNMFVELGMKNRGCSLMIEDTKEDEMVVREGFGK